MKKTIVIIMMLLMMLSLAPVTYAEPATTVTDQEDPTIPPTDSYKFGMTIDDVHDLLGIPDNSEVKYDRLHDIYYDVTYFDLNGHLTFSYDNDNHVSSITWESPVETMTKEQVKTIMDAVEKYYDEKVGTAESQKDFNENPDNGMILYGWEDEFNQTDYFLQIMPIDGKKQISISKQKSLASLFGDPSGTATDKDADQLAADILEALNNVSNYGETIKTSQSRL